MVLEENYSSSPPVVSKIISTANASSIKALSIWEGARAISGGLQSGARREYKSCFTCHLLSNIFISFLKACANAIRATNIFTKSSESFINLLSTKRSTEVFLRVSAKIKAPSTFIEKNTCLIQEVGLTKGHTFCFVGIMSDRMLKIISVLSKYF